jgi:hypothetical protein
MIDRQDHTFQSPPGPSYDRALARAVEWLGDRYLLAKPINAHTLPRPESRRFGVDIASTA